LKARVFGNVSNYIQAFQHHVIIMVGSGKEENGYSEYINAMFHSVPMFRKHYGHNGLGTVLSYHII
jgi:hypothetical protein